MTPAPKPAKPRAPKRVWLTFYLGLLKPEVYDSYEAACRYLGERDIVVGPYVLAPRRRAKGGR